MSLAKEYYDKCVQYVLDCTERYFIDGGYCPKATMKDAVIRYVDARRKLRDEEYMRRIAREEFVAMTKEGNS